MSSSEIEKVAPFAKLTPVRVIVAAPSNVIHPLSASMYFPKSLSLEPRPSPFNVGRFGASPMLGSFGVLTGEGLPDPDKLPNFMALLSLRLGGFLGPVPGTAGADFGSPCGGGLLTPAGSLTFGGTPPTSPAPPMFMFIFVGELEFARKPILSRCSCNARALCMISDGRLFALGVGLLAVLSRPVTLELGLMELVF